ncbi:M24 family metallopeptidase [Candidatus Bipolaricaulota bacterium]
MMLPSSIALQRMGAVQSALLSIDAAAVILGLSSNLRYLTGFSDEPGERLLLLIVPREGEGTLIVPKLYAAQVASHSPTASLRVWSDGDDPWRLVRQVAQQLSPLSGKLLLDDSLWAMFGLAVQQAFTGRVFGLASDVMEGMRERKDEGEIAAMRRAGEITDAAYAAVTTGQVSGLTEISLASRLESAMLAGGADGIAFETLVASGPNSALPHYRAGTRQIESGDVVILDFGCRVSGYCSDITRTVICGEPDNELCGIHEAVRRSHEKAREMVRSGVQAQEIDAAARDVLAGAGYGANFTHRTGHGIGLDVHESPYIVDGNKQRLDQGMAFSIEPGAYFAGAYGVRIEDVVVVTEEGVEAMTHAPHELRRVG